MDQMIENLLVAGVDRTRIDRARRRGITYQCLRCHYKDGTKTLNIKCRIEDHIMRVHLGRDELPFYCKLCGFRCMRRDQLITHVSAYSKHVLLAAKSKVVDHRPYLVENDRPHIFGPLDYKAHTPEASLLHWLGVVDGEQPPIEDGSSVAVIPPVMVREGASAMPASTTALLSAIPLSTPQSTSLTSASLLELPSSTPQWRCPSSVTQTLPPIVSSVPPTRHRSAMTPMSSVEQFTSATHLMSPPATTPTMARAVWSPLTPQYVLSPEGQAKELTVEPFSGLFSPMHAQAEIASQLTTLLQSLVGGDKMSNIAANSEVLPLAIPTETSEPSLELQVPADVETAVVQENGEEQSDSEPSLVLRDPVKADNQNTELQVSSVWEGESHDRGDETITRGHEDENAEAEVGEVGLQEVAYPPYVPTPVLRTEKEQSLEHPHEEDILDLSDENMSLSTPSKRGREDDEEQIQSAKKARDEDKTQLTVNVADLSERTLVELVQNAQKTAERSMSVSEKMTKAMVDATCVLSKLTDAVTRMRNTMEEHDREERRREVRRAEQEQRREDEWRRALYRMRDEERRWEDRRKEWERKDREERKDRDERRKKEDKRGDEKDNDCTNKDKENDQRPRSVLGRIYTRNNIAEGSRRN